MNKPTLLLLGCGALFATAQIQAQTAITDWSFDNLPIGANANPAPATGSGLASALGMNNSYNNTNSISNPDVLSSSGSSMGGPNAWRVRGAGALPNAGNGWSSQAPIGTQGAEFDSSTVGYSGIHVYFDVNTTAQAEANLELEYTIDGSAWNNAAIAYSGTSGTIKNNSTSVNTVMGTYIQFTAASWINGITADLSSIPGADNNPNFGIRLVNASTGVDDINGNGTAYNNTSGNWRFDNVTISGTTVPEPSAFSMAGLGLGLAALRIFRRR